eukprot:TRINITY_DN5443_c0_g1_i1.p1 TRINITY_DN5443_c0_g1~~TRINITY_DN5443_c0_g1_i1.p1  ORF type:complete len:244 (+),score=46.72 TRINITY_DN5443_c0_g1_i1:617-1348(+)
MDNLQDSLIGFEGSQVVSNTRRSQTNWISQDAHDQIADIYLRASILTGTPAIHSEGLQFLHYQPGGFYHPHCDYFAEPACHPYPSESRHQPNPIPDSGYLYHPNRFVTLLLYLNDVEEGGGTSFNRVLGQNENDNPWQRGGDDISCAKGFVSQPKKGRALMFYNLLPRHYRFDPCGDRSSEHVACQVTKGEKWAANFWIWNKSRFQAESETLYDEIHARDDYWRVDDAKNDPPTAKINPEIIL